MKRTKILVAEWKTFLYNDVLCFSFHNVINSNYSNSGSDSSGNCYAVLSCDTSFTNVTKISPHFTNYYTTNYIAIKMEFRSYDYYFKFF